ncbi:helix-turn-helix domain-containing protein [Methylobacter luteus]|uniref:helix-turn-helix domain-containing protein n=1 Tax=Methylobacter luteus TaxID=415 RepID=UPI0003FC8695|nr:helix-turn-helix domain-containing protein [Methylobacter luteus]
MAARSHRTEYANVEVTPPADGSLFNEMTIYPWQALRLSAIRSSAVCLERLPREPHLISHDAYFAVVLLSGGYQLEQNGKAVFLQPGDMTLYDATLPHRIHCPRNFSKLIVSIPRPLLRDRIAGIEHCTALRIPGNQGIGAVAANLLRTSASQTDQLSAQEFSALADHSLDLLTLALASVRPANFNLSRSRSFALNRIKDFIDRHLANPAMDSAMVSYGAGLSSRYVNDLFKDENTSLMRYIWQRRLENCRKDLLDPIHAGHRLSDIAFRWGFNDLSHFSRAFKQRFGCSPKAYRQQMKV